MIESVHDSGDMESLLMVQDDITPPGYAKLQWVQNGVTSRDMSRDSCVPDFFGRPVLSNNTLFENMTHDERNGPSGTTSAKQGLLDMDHVPAFGCKLWPSQAEPWIHKLRSQSWPSKDTIDTFKTHGCFLVPVGHPFSSEKELQWRLSFSIQERKLMLALNDAQYKCYVLLKMIKNDFIKSSIKGKSLTSYHMKTCLFYILESTKQSVWTTGNIILCAQKCISTLKIWLQEGCIPNYFIPEENMWKGNRQIRFQVVKILDDILQQGPEFVFHIRCDFVGKAMLQSVGKENLLISGNSINAGENTTNTPPYMALCPDARNSNVSLARKGGNDELRTYEDKTTTTEPNAANSFNEENEPEIHDDNKIDDIIADAIASAVTSGDDPQEVIAKLEQTFPGCADLFTNLQEVLLGEAVVTDQKCKTVDESTQIRNSQSLSAGKEQELDNQVFVENNNYERQVTSGNTKTFTREAGDFKMEKSYRALDLAIYKIHYWCIEAVLVNSQVILNQLRENDDIDISIKEHLRVIEWLHKQVKSFSVFSETEVKRAIDYILPMIHTSLGSHLAAKALKYNKTDSIMEQYLNSSMSHLFNGQISDAQSGKVKHAAVYFMLGNDSECERLLKIIDENYEPHVTTLGVCLKRTDFVNEKLCNKIRNDRLSTDDILQKYCAGCVTYLPAEIGIVPFDLQYEMFRSVFATTPRRIEEDDYFDYVHIDSTIYLYYLMYRLFERLGHIDEQRRALGMLVLVLQKDRNLGHPDTANNLLGRILLDEGELNAAWQCFCDSWKIRPDHNAAKWHMAIMLYQAVCVLSVAGTE